MVYLYKQSMQQHSTYSTISSDADPPYMNKNPIVRMSESNTEHMSYARRFYDAFIWRAQALWHLGFSPWPIPLAINNKRWEDALKLVNNLYGVEDPRPMGPLVELVGPIYSEDVNAGTLDPDLEQYLDARQRVVYVAFGQFMMATSAETSTRVLHMLLENYEAGELDGFVWSAIRGTPLPEHITTSSGTHYYLNSTEFQNIGRIVPWVSQKAILRHPSIITFVTHGGAGSLYEAAYFGKRMLFTPFCGDQIYHALNFERKNAGLWFILEEADTNTMTTALNQVLKDENGTMQQEARRLQAIFQIHSQHALARATDLVEEVAFTADSDGKLPHRRDIARNLSFFKRNNYDLYLGLLALITAIVTLSYRVVVLVKEHLRIKKKVD